MAFGIAALVCLFIVSGFCYSRGLDEVGDVPIPPTPVFNCPALSRPPPANNVRQLRPGNIKAVMALGDSITAGFAMKGFPVEYRGLVYSTGGDKYVGEFSYDLAVTIPNFLKTYNPDLQGQSEGDDVPFTQGINLNAAIVEAKIADVPKQVTYLVNTLKTQYNTTVDFDEDWKLLTLFIGANNLCICCHNDSRGTPQYFESHLRDILQQIETNIPRTFVNVVALFNISGVWTAGEQHEYCSVLWDGITVGECGCLLEYGDEERKSMDEHSVLYNEVMYKVAAEFASKNNANFTVVVQPGLSGFDIGYFGEGYLSALDCFHPGLPANEAFAIALWNNMLTPPPNKQTTIDPANLKILCPTEDSFFQ